MTRINLLILAVALATVFPRPAFAVLGEDEEAALGKAAEWQRKYGAVAPIVSTDTSGMVIRECWSAPPDGWDQEIALSFAVDLLPSNRRNLAPQPVSSDSCNNAFRVSGGYDICLSGLGASFFDVEVRASAYAGPSC